MGRRLFLIRRLAVVPTLKGEKDGLADEQGK